MFSDCRKWNGFHFNHNVGRSQFAVMSFNLLNFSSSSDKPFLGTYLGSLSLRLFMFSPLLHLLCVLMYICTLLASQQMPVQWPVLECSHTTSFDRAFSKNVRKFATTRSACYVGRYISLSMYIHLHSHILYIEFMFANWLCSDCSYFCVWPYSVHKQLIWRPLI
jgi:hypothetical protein